ncbi:MAG: leucine-rich repeat protein, partial [Spirochaetaceae bacterium]|nr:leucine-rich repeat protein [Spirochaetaceae bacterium]
HGPDPGDPAIPGYEVRPRSGPTWGGWVGIAGSGSATTRHRLTGLTNETAYDVQVRARGAGGNSLPSGVHGVVPRAGICARTAEVRQAILARLPDVGDCAEVTAGRLAAITELRLAHPHPKLRHALQPTDLAGLSGLTELWVDSEHLRRVPAEAFRDLTALTRLTLRNDGSIKRLRALPADLFDGLRALTAIDLRGNDLASLPAELFDDTPALATLDLAGNRLTTLPADLFDGLRALTAVDLGGNALASLPAELFDDTSALATLHLQNNALTALPAELFDGLAALARLDVSRNSLTALPEKLFASTPALTWLDVSRNSLTELPEAPFAGATALTTLDLQYNRLEALPAGMFARLPALAWMSVANNPGAPFTLTMEAEQVSVDSFRVRVAEGAPFAMSASFTLTDGSPSSGTATVPTGAVDGVDVAITRDLPTLTPVVTLTAAAPGPAWSRAIRIALGPPLHLYGRPPPPANLRARGSDGGIVLQWDAIVETPVIAFQTRMRAGDEPFGEWTDVAGSGDLTSSLRLTGLVNGTRYTVEVRARNAIGAGAASSATATPQAGICERSAAVQRAILALLADTTACDDVTGIQLAGITGLDLSAAEVPDGMPEQMAGRITELWSGDFHGLIALTALDLSGNRLAALPGGLFAGLDALATLDASDNRLSDLPLELFRGRTALTALDLSGNRLATVPDGLFDELGALVTLHLGDNRMTAVPAGAFRRLSALADLRLNDNRLTGGGLPAGVLDDLGALTTLHLGNNGLRDLPTDLFGRLDRLTELRLHDNALTSLPAGLFAGLEALTRLDLYGNNLRDLPAGVFSGLGALRELALNNNPGAPFPVALELEQTGVDRFSVTVADGAPFMLRAAFTVAGGSPMQGSITIPAGAVIGAGGTVTVTRASAGTAPVVSLPPPPVPPKVFGLATAVRGAPLALA